MNVPFVVFDIATGQYLWHGVCPPESVDSQAGEGQRVLATSALTLDGIRPVIWEMVKTKREEHYSAGITTPFGVLQTTPDSREKIIGLFADAGIRVSMGGNKDRDFTKTDETQVTLSSVQLVAVGQLVVDYIDAVHQRSQQLRAEIYAAADMAELLAIDVTAGWP